MIRLIMKNLWARRRKNGWLLAELILVSIVTWVIVDPLVVLTHDRNLPEGYRPDHLFLLSWIHTLPGRSNSVPKRMIHWRVKPISNGCSINSNTTRESSILLSS